VVQVKPRASGHGWGSRSSAAWLDTGPDDERDVGLVGVPPDVHPDVMIRIVERTIGAITRRSAIARFYDIASDAGSG
jgi:hypothetical protein